MKDSLMLGLQEEKDKMEVTLDTSGYKPDELKVEIKEGELCVEGKHEERSQTGEVMVSRQFSRRFGMPQNVKKESIVSNLSQDGVMVITMPKEQRIEEVERGDTPIQIDHVRSSSERKTMTEEASAKLKREEISNQGRVDNFDGAGQMQRRRRSLSRAGRSRDTSRARETTTTVETGKDNKESKTSTRGSSRGREMVVERRDERTERARSRARDLQVPMTLRQPFLDDPFFKGTLARLENTREDFFKQARESFEESMKQMESRMSNSLTLNTQGMNDSFFPKDWIMNPPSSLNENIGSMLDRKRDCSTIKHNEDDNKVEVHLDTSGYKPDELKVQVEGGIVRVEGKHEEKSEEGAVMVSRQFVKEYALPESSKPDGVESSLSKDGVLVITIPKPKKAINQDKGRSVPIAIK
jgi:HSP20 family molecular chaperone IbpA